MKFVKYLSILPLAFSLIGVTEAKTTNVFYSVPFRHVEVKEASKIYVNYSFDSHKQVLYCQADYPSNAINTMKWEYKGATRQVELPVILKDDKNFSGYWADPSGVLTITNEYGGMYPDTSIYVSCDYRLVR